MSESATTDAGARKHIRYPIRLPAHLVRGTKASQLYTRDVSFGGLFVHTNLPPPLRELLRIRIVLPPDHEEANLLGMAVHRVEPGGKRPAGIGIKLYGNDPHTSRRWDTFIQYVREHMGYETQPSDSADMRGSTGIDREAVEAVRRRLVRVKIPTLENLWAIADRDLIRGQTVIQTELYFEPGTEITLQLVHPESRKIFDVPAKVDRPFRRGTATGLALGLDVDDVLRNRFLGFLDDEIHISVDLGANPDHP